MVTARLPQDEIDRAVEALRDGEVVAFPTETVYGLGADAQNPEAVRKVFELKGRPATHPLIVHIDHPRAARALGAQRAAGGAGAGRALLARSADAGPAPRAGGGSRDHRRAGHRGGARAGPSRWPSSCCARSAAASRRRRRTATAGSARRVPSTCARSSATRCGWSSTAATARSASNRPSSRAWTPCRACCGRAPSRCRSCAPSCPRCVEGPTPLAPRVPGTDAKHYAPATPLSIVTSGDARGGGRGSSPRDHEKVAVLAMRPPRVANKFMTWINAGPPRRRLRARAVRQPAHARQVRCEGDPRRGSAAGEAVGRGARPPAARGVGRERRDRRSGHRRAARGFRRGHRLPMSSRPLAAGQPCRLTFDHVAGAREARGIAVVIDVFRAFSVAAYAFDAGASRVLPVGEIDDALALGRRFPGRCWPASGTRAGCPGSMPAIRPPRSARSTCAARCSCTRPTPERRAWSMRSAADEVLTGAFVNISAVCRYIRRRAPERVALVRMGHEARERCAEDDLYAECLQPDAARAARRRSARCASGCATRRPR